MPPQLQVSSPHIADTLDAALQRVRSRLTALCEPHRALRGSSAAQLWDEIARTITDGKLVRPAMVIAVVADAGRDVDDTVVELASAVELLHKAFLLHDDVIDHDVQRRGEPNLIGVFGRDGEAAGILAGDLLLAKAHDIVARLDVTAAVRAQLLDALDEALQWSVAGELDDVAFSTSKNWPSLERVFQMLHAKTGAYTVKLPLQWALSLLGAELEPDIVERYSRAVGLAFQIQDDLLGLFGDPRLVGKDRHSDLREGKVTAVIAHAYSTAEWPQIETALGRDGLGAAEGDDVIALLERSGARERAEHDLAEALSEARSAAEQLAPHQRILIGIVEALEGRRA